jgi:glycosyltransferase involved in cell wall biosynthesis
MPEQSYKDKRISDMVQVVERDLLHSERAFHNGQLAATDPTRVSDILLLSSSLLTDRMFLYTKFLEKLDETAKVKIWATSARNPSFQEMWRKSVVSVETFPQIEPFKTFPYNYLRWINELVWDYSLDSPSRMSMLKHVRNKSWDISRHSLKIPARVLSLLRAGKPFENWLEKVLLEYPRCNEASEILQANRPDVLITTSPFLFDQPAIVAVAKKLGIPTLAFIPSWDNVTLRTRLVFKYDGYIVWSEKTRDELHYYYPYTRNAPVYIVGAPQFDIFFQERFYQSREEFCAKQNLRPELPIIVYALGSPNLIREHYGALELAEKIVRGELGDVQMLVRPHPIHDNAEMKEMFDKFQPHIRLQQTAEAGTPLVNRSQDEKDIIEWVNTFRHADVVVNLSSTVTIDAAIFDKPVVNLDFDPEPGQIKQGLVKDINHKWTHFSPIARSGGVWLVSDVDEMVEAIETYLRRPELHREKRRWIAEKVCGYLDGGCGERMAQAVSDFLQYME